MVENIGAGDLRDRVSFQKRELVEDGLGNTVPGGDFVTQFTVLARLKALRGSEAVIQSRLQGRQPYVITVRQSSQTRQVDESWQVIDARMPERIFALTSPATDPDNRRAWFDFLAVEGGES